jgi:hypothetical protein
MQVCILGDACDGRTVRSGGLRGQRVRASTVRRKALRLLRALAVAGLLCGVVLASGCGQGGSSAGETDQETSVARVIVPPYVPLPPGRSGCGRAIVRLGARRRTLVVQARCQAPDGRHHVNLAIGRYVPGRPGDTPRFSAFARSPEIVGGGTVRRAGRCTGDAGTVACDASIGGQAELRVWLQVGSPPCVGGVSVVTFSDRTCVDEACAGALRVNGLYRGRPRGCS